MSYDASSDCILDGFLREYILLPYFFNNMALKQFGGRPSTTGMCYCQ